MSKKLAGYVFRRIHGRIVPIRKSLHMAAKEISDAASKVISSKYRHKAPGLTKLGKGVDFDVFSVPKMEAVLKVPASNPSREIKSRKLLAAIPGINDKVARSQAIADNLPNYGIPTLQTFSVRVSRRLKALVQPFAKTGTSAAKHDDAIRALNNTEFVRREGNKLGFQSGLVLDAHFGNISQKGELIDTGLGKLPTYKTITQSTRQKMMGGAYTDTYSDPELAKEILDGGYFGRAPKDFKSADYMTERAALEGASSKITRTFKALKQKGWRLSKIEKNVYSPVDPAARIELAKTKGISFVMKNGKLSPVRGKK